MKTTLHKDTWFKSDYNKYTQPHFLRLRRELGARGYGLYTMLIEMMASGYIKTDYIGDIAYEIREDEEVLRAVIFNYKLFTVFLADGEEVFAPIEIIVADQLREKLVENGKKGAEKRWGKKREEEKEEKEEQKKVEKIEKIENKKEEEKEEERVEEIEKDTETEEPIDKSFFTDENIKKYIKSWNDYKQLDNDWIVIGENKKNIDFLRGILPNIERKINKIGLTSKVEYAIRMYFGFVIKNKEKPRFSFPGFLEKESGFLAFSQNKIREGIDYYKLFNK